MIQRRHRCGLCLLSGCRRTAPAKRRTRKESSHDFWKPAIAEGRRRRVNQEHLPPPKKKEEKKASPKATAKKKARVSGNSKAAPTKPVGADKKGGDATRPLDGGKLGQAAPAPKAAMGKPFSVARQKVLADLTKRLTKAIDDHQEARTKSRELGAKVKSLNDELLNELHQNTDLLPFTRETAVTYNTK